MKKLWRKIVRWIEKQTGSTKPPVEQPNQPSGDWRRDVAEVRAVDGAVEFRTRGITRPTGYGLNADGGFEWIIARVHGNGYSRLLIMVMGGNRDPSRIYLQAGDDAPFWNGRFTVPMQQEAAWRVEAPGGRLRILLDGREIWRSDGGGQTVAHAVMHGYPKRQATGEWR
jgi:hypothetical protein